MIVIYQITEDSIRSEVCCWVWEIITHTEGEIIGKIDFEFLSLVAFQLNIVTCFCGQLCPQTDFSAKIKL